MKSRSRCVHSIGWFVIVLVCALSRQGAAFDRLAHQQFGDRAEANSGFGSYVATQLHMLHGHGEVLTGQQKVRYTGGLTASTTQSALEWLKAGSVDEDVPVPRVRFHFHDPTLPYESAGLNIPTGSFESSAIWQQDRASLYSWLNARDSFHQALTSTSDSDRQKWLAATFYTVGHVMHLVQDAASPAHTRNDAHDPYFGGPDRFHGWAEQHTSLISGFGSQSFDQSIIRASPSGSAPVPIANIIDTGGYNTTGPRLGYNVGLAEFSNTNFFSDDTIANSPFIFPTRNGIALTPAQLDSKTGNQRKYLVKTVSDGQITLSYILAPTALYEVEPDTYKLTYVGLDDNVFDSYAALLFPRAVGYSAGLIDYFFRGRLEIKAPSNYVYGLAPYVQPGNTGSFTKLKLQVRNVTAYDGQTGSGTLWAVVQYRKPSTSTDDLIQNPAAPITLAQYYAVSDPLPATVGPDFGADQTFTFTGNNVIPANAADVFLMVVYRGPLGLESDGIAVGTKDIFEPDAIDMVETSDYDCYSSTLYYTPPLTAQQRDVNHDGFQDLFGPYNDYNLYIKAMILNDGSPYASASRYDFYIPTQGAQSAPQYDRYLLLQDAEYYEMALKISQSTDTSNGSATSNENYVATLRRVINDVTLDGSGNYARNVRFPVNFRGLLARNALQRVTGNVFNNATCQTNLYSKSPAPTRLQNGVLNTN